MYYKTTAGILQLSSNSKGIAAAIFVDADIKTHSAFNESDIKFDLNGTPFQIKVWEAALQIPVGKTCTYHDLAKKIGQPKAYRAVANALGQNKIAYFIPCHRVIRKDGSLGGYKWGIDKKIKLLESEGVKIAHQK